MSFKPQFPGQDEGEVVKALLRRHWIRLFDHAVWFIIQVLIPLIGVTLLWLFTDIRVEPESVLYIACVLSLSLYYLFIVLFFFADLVGYHLDIWVVTDRRLVSIEQLSLFHRIVSEQPILKVQDVTHEVKGQLQTMLDFGNVHIQTAGEQERFIFEDVPHPDRVAKLILNTHEQAIHAGDVRRVGLYQPNPPTTPPSVDHVSQI